MTIRHNAQNGVYRMTVSVALAVVDCARLSTDTGAHTQLLDNVVEISENQPKIVHTVNTGLVLIYLPRVIWLAPTVTRGGVAATLIDTA
jgi:hypothetical protein